MGFTIKMNFLELNSTVTFFRKSNSLINIKNIKYNSYSYPLLLLLSICLINQFLYVS